MRRVTQAEVAKIRVSLKAAQNNLCAICKTTFTQSQIACVDHDHDTGVIRGVLCRNCNQAEGKIRGLAVRYKRTLPYFEWIKNYMRYMLKHEKPQTTWLHPSHKTPLEKAEETRHKQRVAYAKRVGNPRPKRKKK